jgi:hypothetical protein
MDDFPHVSLALCVPPIMSCQLNRIQFPLCTRGCPSPFVLTTHYTLHTVHCTKKLNGWSCWRCNSLTTSHSLRGCKGYNPSTHIYGTPVDFYLAGAENPHLIVFIVHISVCQVHPRSLLSFGVKNRPPLAPRYVVGPKPLLDDWMVVSSDTQKTLEHAL